MKRFVLAFLLVALVFSFVDGNARPYVKDPEGLLLKARPKITDDMPLQDYEVIPPRNHQQNDHPRRDLVLGDTMRVGDTWYDYQTNGTIGKMIAKDPAGGIHITWMDGEMADLANTPRAQKYNYWDPNAEAWISVEGEPASSDDRGGYGSIWITNEDAPRGMVFFHQGTDDLATYCGIDFLAGIGAFQEHRLPNYPEQTVIWPQGVMSPENVIHVVYNRRDADMISYCRGILDGDNVEFLENPIQISNSQFNSYRIARSPVSERAAIAFLYPRLGFEPNELWEGLLVWQMNSDMYLVTTEDGENWNFENPRNITDCIYADGRQEGEAAYGDTLRPFSTFDMIFDQGDNLHIVFDARMLKVQPEEDWVERPPVDGVTLAESHLFHWSEENDEFSCVATGWWDHNIYDEDGRLIRRIDPGYWHESNVCQPSLGYDDNGDLYCVFNIYPPDDYSVYNLCNGDIAATVSEDNGATWYNYTMLTETRSLEAENGEHLCEKYPSLAENVDDFLHIGYELDTEPGSPLTDYPDEGRDEHASLAQWYYMKVPTELIERDEIYAGPPWHVNQLPIVMEAERDLGVPLPGNEVNVSTQVLPNGGNELAGVNLEYVVIGDNADTVSVDMNNIQDNDYSGVIPGQDDGAYVWYRIRATDDEGNETVRPQSWWYSYVVRPEGQLTIRDVQYRPEDWTASDASPFNGYEVTVTGSITTPEEFVDVYGGFAIQDSDELWSGVVVRGLNPELPRGQSVTVTGIVRERDETEPAKWAYMTYIEIEDEGQVTDNGAGDLWEPRQTTMDELKFSTHAEHLEGMLIGLVEVEIDTVNVDPAFEGIYFPLSKMIDGEEHEAWITTYGLEEDTKNRLQVDEWRQGTSFGYLDGIWVENQSYAIAPRSMEDLVVGVEDRHHEQPQEYALDPAYPNPFNNITKIGFTAQKAGEIDLSVFDLNGRLIRQLQNGMVEAGHHTLSFNAGDLSAGTYVLRLEAKDVSIEQKMVLMK